LILGENTPLQNRDLRVAAPNDKNVPVKRKDEIIKHLLINPSLSAGELAVIFSVTDKTIKRDFAALKEDGRIKRVGSFKTGHWEVKQ